MRHHRYAVVPAWKQHIDQSSDPGPVRRCPEKIIFLWKEIVGKLDPRQMSQKRAMGMQCTFGRPGGARCVDDQGRIIRSGFYRLKIRKPFFHHIPKTQHLPRFFTSGHQNGF